MTRLVGRVLEAQRHLPAHRRLPVHRSLAGFECSDVQRTAGPAFESRTIEKDARVDPLVRDQTGDGGRVAVAIRITGPQISAPRLPVCAPGTFHGLVVELHVPRLEPSDVL